MSNLQDKPFRPKTSQKPAHYQKHFSFSGEFTNCRPVNFHPSSLKGKNNILAFKSFLHERVLIQNNINKHRHDSKAVEVITEGLLKKFKLNKDYQKSSDSSRNWNEQKQNMDGDGDGEKESVLRMNNQKFNESKRGKQRNYEEEDYDQTVKRLMKASVGLEEYERQREQIDNSVNLTEVSKNFDSFCRERAQKEESQHNAFKKEKPIRRSNNSPKNIFLSRVEGKLVSKYKDLVTSQSLSKPRRIHKLEKNIQSMVHYAKNFRGIQFPQSSNIEEQFDFVHSPLFKNRSTKKHHNKNPSGSSDHKAGSEQISTVPARFLKMLQSAKSPISPGQPRQHHFLRPRTTQRSRYF